MNNNAQANTKNLPLLISMNNQISNTCIVENDNQIIGPLTRKNLILRLIFN